MAWTEPLTYVAGSIYTAAQANSDLRDNPNYLIGDTAWMAATLQNSWVAYGSPLLAPAYRKLGDLVYVRGVVKNGSSLNAVIFTLPASYRPQYRTDLGGISNGVYCSLIVNTDGTINVTGTSGSTAWVALDGIRFPVS